MASSRSLRNNAPPHLQHPSKDLFCATARPAPHRVPFGRPGMGRYRVAARFILRERFTGFGGAGGSGARSIDFRRPVTKW